MLRDFIPHAIIKNVLRGQATRLDGVVGPGQYRYDPNTKERYPFDPEKAKALLKQAGFPNGVDVDFYTSTGRYLFDKTIAAAIVPMLQAVGIRARHCIRPVLDVLGGYSAWSSALLLPGGANGSSIRARRWRSIRPAGHLASEYPTQTSIIGCAWSGRRSILRNAKRFLTRRSARFSMRRRPVSGRYRNVYGVAKSIRFKARPDDHIESDRHRCATIARWLTASWGARRVAQPLWAREDYGCVISSAGGNRSHYDAFSLRARSHSRQRPCDYSRR